MLAKNDLQKLVSYLILLDFISARDVHSSTNLQFLAILALNKQDDILRFRHVEGGHRFERI
jgi:hypothetical protein